jgi:hypothetical protein
MTGNGNLILITLPLPLNNMYRPPLHIYHKFLLLPLQLTSPYSPTVRSSNSVVPKLCASAPLGVVTSSQRLREILRNFLNFVSIFNSMSLDETSSGAGANHLAIVCGSLCKWPFSEIVSTEYFYEVKFMKYFFLICPFKNGSVFTKQQ